MTENFRRIPVDLYDEDRVLPLDLYIPDTRSPDEVAQIVQGKTGEIRSFLQKADLASALAVALEGYPFGEGVDAPKAQSLQNLLLILNSTKSTDIPALVAGLSSVDQVTLMKYLYKAMENLGDSNGNVILGWHEKLVEAAGTGTIVRVMTDHKRV